MVYLEPQLLLTYLIAITLLSMAPGLDTMLVIRNTVRGGWRDGFVSSFGICCGLFVHATVSAVGISVILLQTAWAFSALKLAGAGYIVWLGLVNLRFFFRKRQRDAGDLPPTPRESFRFVRSLREGVLSNVLNPKPVVFYMAFLPQFIDPQHSALIQSLLLAGFHFVIAMVWQCLLAVLVSQARRRLFQPSVGRVFEGLTGTVLVALGVRLALDNG